MDITCPPPGKRTTKLSFNWNVDGTLKSVLFYQVSELLFTLTFVWNLDGTLNEVSRLEGV
jgi:hypothetical protein